MKPFTKIKAFLNQRPNQYISSTMVFNELDLDVMIQQLELKEKGQKRGASDLPNTKAKDLDIVETEIISAIESEKNRCYSTLLDELQAYDSRMAALSLDNKVFEIKSAAENAKSEFEAESRDGINQLERDLQHVKEMHRSREDFKKRNKLTRPAFHPKSPILNWGIICILFLAECLINAEFFSTGLDGGLLGGLIQALAIAFVNICLGLSVGKFVYPNVNNIKIKWRIFGWLTIPVYLLCAVTLNLFVAHYRMALTGDNPDFASTVAVSSFVTHPFGLNDFLSWMILCIGFIFSIIASIDSFKMNDSFPGYSKIEKKYDSVLQNYSDHHADIIDNLREIKDTAIDDIHQAKNIFSERRAEFDSIIVYRQGVLNAFTQRIQYLQNCARHLLNVYREINIASRKTDAPCYFNDSFILQSPMQSDTPNVYSKNQENLDTTTLSIYNNLDEITENMHSEFTLIQKRFPLLDAILREQES